MRGGTPREAYVVQVGQGITMSDHVPAGQLIDNPALRPAECIGLQLALETHRV
ncbi:hypothetical protein ABZY16_35450 [Streptomyces sp. NPDC006553]|uniref:hypothetical protein n=1 Tax=unclassified Streptomyces TaxID=2593676 RepID=UPI002251B222|nr:hypothetical protein [Streptomyces sp. NBC_00233]MCX5230916.1 hypothetical protein [Streptomyces sp. NBC_00233]